MGFSQVLLQVTALLCLAVALPAAAVIQNAASVGPLSPHRALPSGGSSTKPGIACAPPGIPQGDVLRRLPARFPELLGRAPRCAALALVGALTVVHANSSRRSFWHTRQRGDASVKLRAQQAGNETDRGGPDSSSEKEGQVESAEIHPHPTEAPPLKSTKNKISMQQIKTRPPHLLEVASAGSDATILRVDYDPATTTIRDAKSALLQTLAPEIEKEFGEVGSVVLLKEPSSSPGEGDGGPAAPRPSLMESLGPDDALVADVFGPGYGCAEDGAGEQATTPAGDSIARSAPAESSPRFGGSFLSPRGRDDDPTEPQMRPADRSHPSPEGGSRIDANQTSSARGLFSPMRLDGDPPGPPLQRAPSEEQQQWTLRIRVVFTPTRRTCAGPALATASAGASPAAGQLSFVSSSRPLDKLYPKTTVTTTRDKIQAFSLLLGLDATVFFEDAGERQLPYPRLMQVEEHPDVKTLDIELFDEVYNQNKRSLHRMNYFRTADQRRAIARSVAATENQDDLVLLLRAARSLLYHEDRFGSLRARAEEGFGSAEMNEPQLATYTGWDLLRRLLPLRRADVPAAVLGEKLEEERSRNAGEGDTSEELARAFYEEEVAWRSCKLRLYFFPEDQVAGGGSAQMGEKGGGFVTRSAEFRKIALEFLAARERDGKRLSLTVVFNAASAEEEGDSWLFGIRNLFARDLEGKVVLAPNSFSFRMSRIGGFVGELKAKTAENDRGQWVGDEDVLGG